VQAVVSRYREQTIASFSHIQPVSRKSPFSASDVSPLALSRLCLPAYRTKCRLQVDSSGRLIRCTSSHVHPTQLSGAVRPGQDQQMDYVLSHHLDRTRYDRVEPGDSSIRKRLMPSVGSLRTHAWPGLSFEQPSTLQEVHECRPIATTHSATFLVKPVTIWHVRQI
jgi:hypothetical protein